METTISVTSRAEIDKLSSIQNEIYHRANKPLYPRIDSEFNNVVIASTWYSANDISLEKQEIDRKDEMIKIKYSVAPSQSFCTKIQIRPILPEIRVKKKYAGDIVICWPHNPANSIVVTGEKIMKDYTTNTISNYWLNTHPQFDRKNCAGSDRNFNIGVGNQPFLENWSTVLPEYECNVDQPFGFTKNTTKALPIFLWYKGDKLNFDIFFRYQYNLKVSKILRMGRRQPDGCIKPIKFNKKYIKGPAMIDVPNMTARYCYIADNEVAFIKKEKVTPERTERYFFNDVTNIKYNDGVKYGKEYPVVLDNKSATTAVMYSAEDKVDREKYNVHANYTSSPDVYKGWNMISNSSLKYGPIPKFGDFGRDQVENGQPRDYANTCQMDNGYNLYALCNRPFSGNMSPGVIFANRDTTLIVTVSNTDPMATITEENENEEKEKDDSDSDSDSGSDSDGDDDDVITGKDDKTMVSKKKKSSKKYIINVAMLSIRMMEVKPDPDDATVYTFSVV